MASSEIVSALDTAEWPDDYRAGLALVEGDGNDLLAIMRLVAHERIDMNE